MNEDPPDPKRFAGDSALIALFQRYVDARLDPSDLSQLNDVLRASDDVRSEFVDFLTQQAYLCELLTPQSTDGSTTPKGARTTGALPAPVPLPAAVPLPASSANPAWTVATASDDPPALGSHAFGISWLGGWPVVFGLIAAATIVIAAFQAGRQSGQSAVAANAKPADSSVEAAGPCGIRSLQLESGAARWAIKDVGWVVAEGSVDFDLIGPKRAKITRGRIKMRVTEKSGQGFVVETPYGEVTDLGTEFGLDLTEPDRAGLVVFEGAVDLRVAGGRAPDGAKVERLTGGEGVVFDRGGPLNRISTVLTGNVATFLRRHNEGPLVDVAPSNPDPSTAVIADVTDNLPDSKTKKFYEIVPGGLREDAASYGDRPHEWNGMTSEGMPTYLVGADYVKTFNFDHTEPNQEILVTLARPAKLFVFLDVRVEAPEWLKANFENTGDTLGQDAAPNRMKEYRNRTLAVGPGQSIDEKFTVWVQTVPSPGVVRLGSNIGRSERVTPRGMYGIAAVALGASESSPTPE